MEFWQCQRPPVRALAAFLTHRERLGTVDGAMGDPARRIEGQSRQNLRRCRTCGERFPPDYLVCPRDATPLGVSPDATDPLLGVVLAGSYRITRLLAKGGMGRLYEAEHARLPRRLVAKVIHDHYAGHPDAVARFEREARAAASIDSDHVLDVVDVVRTPDDRPCIVAERLEGTDLQTRLEHRGRLPLHEAVRIARQLCRGLAAAHAAGVVHRDLKPSNIFLAANAHGHETVKILDFGVAKLVGVPDITRDGAVVGTPAYMAPEQARGAARVDGRADLYAVGAVLYRMLTGHAPFEAKDATASLTRLLSESPVPARTFVPGLPEAVEEILAGTLARDPNDRPADALELERALRRLDAESDAPPDADLAGVAPEPAETTLVLPRGSVAGAALAARRLRRARPLAALAGAGLTLATALAVASLLHAFDAVPGVLVPVGALGAALCAATAYGRALRAAWPTGAAVQALLARATRALLVAMAATGAAALAVGGLALDTLAFTPPAAALLSAAAVIVGDRTE